MISSQNYAGLKQKFHKGMKINTFATLHKAKPNTGNKKTGLNLAGLIFSPSK
jgi:hypothetical protein